MTKKRIILALGGAYATALGAVDAAADNVLAESIQSTVEVARENPATTIGAGVGGAYGGAPGAAIGAGAGAVLDNQGRHIDPGPSVGRAVRQAEISVRRALGR